MNKQEIKAAMLKVGAIRCYLGTKWDTHYDPRAATYSIKVNREHGNSEQSVHLRKAKRCSIYVTDAEGITTQSGECDCHYGEWIAEPHEWAVALLEVLGS